MNSLRLLAGASSIPPPPAMLAESLALHERMIRQLQLELLGAVTSIGLVTALLEQHEKAAANLRAELATQPTATAPDGTIVITGEASSPAARSRITNFVRANSGLRLISNRMTVKTPSKPSPFPNQSGDASES